MEQYTCRVSWEIITWYLPEPSSSAIRFRSCPSPIGFPIPGDIPAGISPVCGEARWIIIFHFGILTGALGIYFTCRLSGWMDSMTLQRSIQETKKPPATKEAWVVNYLSIRAGGTNIHWPLVSGSVNYWIRISWMAGRGQGSSLCCRLALFRDKAFLYNFDLLHRIYLFLSFGFYHFGFCILNKSFIA